MSDIEFEDDLEISNCCGASVIPETDICTECLEHCEVINESLYFGEEDD